MSELKISGERSPDTFFMKFLPSLFKKKQSALPAEVTTINVAITFELFGEEGGEWTLIMEDGNLTVTPGDTPDRVVKIQQKVEDWFDAMRRKRGFRIDLQGQKQGERTFISREMIGRLKSIQGSIKFQLSEPDMDDWEITAIFGPETPPKPTCTISMSAADAVAIRLGELSPQAAFMSGKINIEGEIGFALLIGAALTN